MQQIVESFLESDFDSALLARQKRDLRVAELSAQGYLCRVENLTTIHTGLRIFFVIAQPSSANGERGESAVPHSPATPTPSEPPHPKSTPLLREPRSGKLQFEDRSQSRQADHSRSQPEEPRRPQPQNRSRPNLRDRRTMT